MVARRTFSPGYWTFDFNECERNDAGLLALGTRENVTHLAINFDSTLMETADEST
jgi:hypothetical protein